MQQIHVAHLRSQEGWHQTGVTRRLKNELNASTEHVLNKSLAKVITLDGINAPDALERSVPKEWISPSLYEDAFKYINDADKYIMRKPMVRNADGTVSHDVYYVLSQSQKTFKKISASLIDR